MATIPADPAALARCLREVRMRGLYSGFVVAAKDGSAHHWYSARSQPGVADDEIEIDVPGAEIEIEEIDADYVADVLRGRAEIERSQEEDRKAYGEDADERVLASHAYNGGSVGSGWDAEAVARISGGMTDMSIVALRRPDGPWSLARHYGDIGGQADLDSLCRHIAGNYVDDLDWQEPGDRGYGKLAQEFDRLAEAAA